MTDSGRVFMPDESAKRYSAVSKADEEGAYEPEAPVEGVFENWLTWKKSVRFVNTQSETFFWGPKDETMGRHRDSGSVTGWVTIAPAKPDLETVAVFCSVWLKKEQTQLRNHMWRTLGVLMVLI